jgi:hypothetical protein
MPLIIRKNKKDMSEHIKRLINSKKGFSLNYEIETKKGDIKSIHEKCEPVFGLEGKLKYFDGIITEILLE